MSFANYGPDFRVQSVTNLLVAPIVVPITADGAAQVVTNLIQTAAGAELPLVLGEGVWIVNARAVIDPDNAANTIQYIQGQIVGNGGTVVAASSSVVGADILNGANAAVYFLAECVLVIAPGATQTLRYRLFSTGNSAAFSVVTGFSNIVATKLSA